MNNIIEEFYYETLEQAIEGIGYYFRTRDKKINELKWMLSIGEDGIWYLECEIDAYDDAMTYDEETAWDL